MLNIDSLFLFIFVFSLLGALRVVGKILVSLFSASPSPVMLGLRETIIFGLFLSYILTYIFN